MNTDDVKHLAFQDEFAKISGEMQGHTRIGRKPIGIEKMLENEAEVTGLPESFSDAADQAGRVLAKTAASLSHAAALALGAGGAVMAVKANNDRKAGRAMRKAQQAQMAQQY